MACYKPLEGFLARKVLPSGRRPVVFNRTDGFVDLPVQLPCGRCIGCRLERSRQWAVRCMHEASMHDENSFVTLTYSDDCLPVGGSLVFADLQKFMKRLRRRFPAKRISFYACGEYGENLGRPHFHALLFGHWFSDSVYFKMSDSGEKLYRSSILESLWKFGHSYIGAVTFESAGYVARYITKKITGDMAEAHYNGRVPEGSRMSLRPAIGKRWLERYVHDVYPSDSVVVRGRETRPPLYYDKLLGKSEASALLEEAKKARASGARDLKVVRNRTVKRLAVREEVTKARLGLYKK